MIIDYDSSSSLYKALQICSTTTSCSYLSISITYHLILLLHYFSEIMYFLFHYMHLTAVASVSAAIQVSKYLILNVSE